MKVMKNKLFFIFAPVFLFFSYVVGTGKLAAFTGNSVVASMIIDGVVIACGLLAFFVFRSEKQESEPFRPRAWAVLLWILAVMVLWFVTQCMSLCVTLRVEDTGLQAYNQVVSENIGLWIILAVCVAPAAEEVIFRGCMYSCWKRVFGMFSAAVLSSLAFAWIHGTLAHLPVAFLMGMFHVAVLEITGEFKYVVFSHMIYNFLSVGAVIPIGEDVQNGFLCSIWFNILIGVVVLIGIICLYVWRMKVRKFLVTAGKLDYWNRKWDE